MAKVLDTQTGQTIEVDVSKLGDYGITPDQYNTIQRQNLDKTQTNPLVGGAESLLNLVTPRLLPAIKESVKRQQKTQPKNLGEALNPLKAIQDFAYSILEPTLPAASELALYGSGGSVPSLALSGGLYGATASEAKTPQEKVVGAGLGAAANLAFGKGLPVIAGTVSKTLGRTALGPGGAKIGELSQEMGRPLMGAAQTIKENLYNWTEPIRNKVSDLLIKSGGAISREKVYSIMDGALERVGTVDLRAAEKYVDALKSRFDSMFIKSLKRPEMAPIVNEGRKLVAEAPERGVSTAVGDKMGQTLIRSNRENLMNQPIGSGTFIPRTPIGPVAPPPPRPPSVLRQAPDRTVGIAIDYAYPVPLDLWHKLIGMLDEDIGNKRIDLAQGKHVPGRHKVANSIRGQLNKLISENTGNPEEYKRLNSLLQAATEIKSNLEIKKLLSGSHSISSLIRQLGIPAEIIYSILMGRPEMALGGLAVGAATSPAVATRASTVLRSRPVQRGLRTLGNFGLTQFSNSIGGGTNPEVNQ